MAIDTIKFKRGVKSKLNNLSYGEPAYISDENELYIGTEDGVEKITRNKEVAELSSQLEHITIVTPEMFGGVGDGVTDNTQFLQSMFNSINGNTIIIFNGKYKINNQINIINKDNLTLCGAGTIINPSGSRGLYVSECRNLTINDIEIEGEELARCGITLYNCEKSTLNNIKIQNIGNDSLDIPTAGIEIIGDCSYSNIVNVVVDNINAKSNATGISISHYIDSDNNKIYSKYISINNCKISNIIPSNDGDGVKILQNYLDSYFIIDSCTFINCAKRGIKIQGYNCKVSNSKFLGGCSYASIDFQNGKGKINNCEISVGNSYGVIFCSGGDVEVDSVTIDCQGSLNGTNCVIRCSGFDTDIDKKWGNMIFKNLHIKNAYYIFDLKKINDSNFNSCDTLSFENITIDNVIYHVLMYLNDISIENLYLNNIYVKNNSSNFMLLSGTNNNSSSVFIDNCNIASLFASHFLTNFRNVKKCFIRDSRILNTYDVPYCVYDNFRKEYYFYESPKDTGGTRGNIYNCSKIGDVCFNTDITMKTDSLSYYIEKWLCVDNSSDLNPRGVWKEVRITV